ADAAKAGDAQKLAQNMQSAGERMGNQRSEQQMSQGSMQKAMDEIDRMQGQNGSQSTMANQGGNQGQNGQQPNGGQDPNGGQQPNGGQNGQQMANAGGEKPGEGQGQDGPGQGQ